MKRNRVEIIRDLLAAAQSKGGVIKPTHLLYRANLSHAALQKYVGELVESGMFEERESPQGRRYAITDKGHAFLAEYNKFSSFAERFGI